MRGKAGPGARNVCLLPGSGRSHQRQAWTGATKQCRNQCGMYTPGRVSAMFGESFKVVPSKPALLFRIGWFGIGDWAALASESPGSVVEHHFTAGKFRPDARTVYAGAGAHRVGLAGGPAGALRRCA